MRAHLYWIGPAARSAMPTRADSGLRSHYDASITAALKSQAVSGSFSDTLHRISYVVSYRTLPSTGWRIYSAAPANSFYEKSIFVQKLILGICLIALLIGIVLSGIWAKASYNPIKRLVGKIKHLADPAPDHASNEYGMIDTAFIQLNDKVSSLEETLHANSTVIRHNIVLNILQNNYSREELAADLPILGILPRIQSLRLHAPKLGCSLCFIKLSASAACDGRNHGSPGGCIVAG